jgi:hypothetical protein
MTYAQTDTDSLVAGSLDAGAPIALVTEAETAPLPDLERAICAWAGRIAAATCQLLTLLAAFDRRGGWSGLGMTTCAQWLSWRCGIGIRTAQEHMAVAHALEELPAVRAAFAEGRLSYSKVRAVARVAESATEQSWLAHALCCTAGQLERLASRFRQLTANPAEQRRARRVTWSSGSDGLFHLRAVLTVEEGARLSTAIDAARAGLEDSSPPRADAAAETSPADAPIVQAARDRQSDADALMALADGFLHRPVPRLMSPAHTVTVHVDAETLLGAGPVVNGVRETGNTEGDQIRGPARGAERPPAVLRRLGCDGLVRALVRDRAGNPLALGRRRRVPTSRLREAVYARDQGICQYPGCTHTRWLQVHHLREWFADEGETDVENLTLVCTRHHQLTHDEGITLSRRADGSVVATLRDGLVVIPAPRLDGGALPAVSLAEALSDVADDAIQTRGGGRLSWDDSLLVLMQHRREPAGSPAA